MFQLVKILLWVPVMVVFLQSRSSVLCVVLCVWTEVCGVLCEVVLVNLMLILTIYSNTKVMKIPSIFMRKSRVDRQTDRHGRFLQCGHICANSRILCDTYHEYSMDTYVYVKFKVLTVLTTNINVLWEVTPCSLVDFIVSEGSNAYFDFEHGSSTFIRNVGKYLSDARQ
jgi:hypothetical protein